MMNSFLPDTWWREKTDLMSLIGLFNFVRHTSMIRMCVIFITDNFDVSFSLACPATSGFPTAAQSSWNRSTASPAKIPTQPRRQELQEKAGGQWSGGGRSQEREEGGGRGEWRRIYGGGCWECC